MPSNQSEAQHSQVPQVATMEQHAEPPHHKLPTLREKQAEIDRLTYMAQQWSTEEPQRVSEGPTHYSNLGRSRSACHHSTPNMSQVPQCHHHHRQCDGQGQHRYNHYDWRSQHKCGQEQDERRYSNMYQNIDNNSTTVVLNALESFSAKQALAPSTLNTIQEFDSSNKERIIPWLDQVELVAKRTGIDPLEVGISKLKGLALDNINTTHKEEGLSCYKFRQCLIEQNSNVPYVSDAMFPYSQIAQQDDEPAVQYLIRANVLLQCVHCTSKLSAISGTGIDNLSLI